MDFFEKFSAGVLFIITGVAGAIVGLVVHTEIQTFWQRLSFFFGGLCCAVFAGPYLGDLLGLVGYKSVMALGFATGIFGMSLLQRIKVFVQALDIGAVIRARFSGAPRE